MENRIEKALELHQAGYNCAQAVVCAYCDKFGVAEETAYKMTEGFGLGMGMMEVCGALSGAFVLNGLKNSAGLAAPGSTKGQVYKTNRELAEAFRQVAGSCICREIKGTETGKVLLPCGECVRHACRIVEENLL